MVLFPLKVDEVHEVKIDNLENEGAGVTKIGGMIVFVPKALPGEEVRIRITEIKKNFARAKLIEVLKPSSSRVNQDCPYYEECGGCNLRHLRVEKCLEFKKDKVQNAIKRIGKIDVKVEDTVPCFKNDHYRNKASFKVEKNRVGFYAAGTYQLVDIEKCELLENEINDALEVVREYLKNNDNEIKTVTIKRGNAMNELLIDVYSTSEQDKKIFDFLVSNVDNLKTVIFNDKVVYGNGYVSQIANGLMFNCSAKSFFQVNDVQTEKLYKLAIEAASLNKEDVVLDLYCGTGTMSCIMANHVKQVIGVEIVYDAVIDANCNARINNLSNVKFICGDATKSLSKIKDNVDVVFVDPPRAGVDRKAIALIKKLSPKKIIYVSCNPVTLARDLGYLSDNYELKKVIPVDMFPRTSHVECVCVLKRR